MSRHLHCPVCSRPEVGIVYPERDFSVKGSDDEYCRSLEAMIREANDKVLAARQNGLPNMATCFEQLLPRYRDKLVVATDGPDVVFFVEKDPRDPTRMPDADIVHRVELWEQADFVTIHTSPSFRLGLGERLVVSGLSNWRDAHCDYLNRPHKPSQSHPRPGEVVVAWLLDSYPDTEPVVSEARIKVVQESESSQAEDDEFERLETFQEGDTVRHNGERCRVLVYEPDAQLGPSCTVEYEDRPGVAVDVKTEELEWAGGRNSFGSVGSVSDFEDQSPVMRKDQIWPKTKNTTAFYAHSWVLERCSKKLADQIRQWKAAPLGGRLNADAPDCDLFCVFVNPSCSDQVNMMEKLDGFGRRNKVPFFAFGECGAQPGFSREQSESFRIRPIHIQKALHVVYHPEDAVILPSTVCLGAVHALWRLGVSPALPVGQQILSRVEEALHQRPLIPLLILAKSCGYCLQKSQRNTRPDDVWSCVLKATQQQQDCDFFNFLVAEFANFTEFELRRFAMFECLGAEEQEAIAFRRVQVLQAVFQSQSIDAPAIFRRLEESGLGTAPGAENHHRARGPGRVSR
eukprot:CAMPEP_0204349830 /NCGR_PEP_ID=MMETSP0469-20131031/29836_1 /ASSEMBLY_ACC=CAM_ASM_000384 /TAXON_ID=2969 /ORGANISM="Oxyrrhis marina" /LENGTH=571 /DNA_ID=CAMNT_0051336083 /DNA_START=33 /DNA_END=1748 /DNA_ORIENTATION=+